MGNMRRIGFRSDSRDPDEIYKTGGFFTRSFYSYMEYLKYDTNQFTAICLSWRLSVCPYLPVDREISTTWIYVLNIDLSTSSEDEIFNSRVKNLQQQGQYGTGGHNYRGTFANIHGAQYLDTITNDEKHSQENSKHVGLFFAEEVAVRSIMVQDILFAVKCERELFDGKRNGGQYKLIGPIIENPEFKPGAMAQQMVDQAREYIVDEIEKSKNAALPIARRESGYQRRPPIVLPKTSAKSAPTSKSWQQWGLSFFSCFCCKRRTKNDAHLTLSLVNNADVSDEKESKNENAIQFGR